MRSAPVSSVIGSALSSGPEHRPPLLMKRPIAHLRWYIGGLLFLSTVVNYIDRQTLSVLGPYLKTEFRWANTDFMWIIVWFRIAYSIGQTAAGRFLDRVGTK